MTQSDRAACRALPLVLLGTSLGRGRAVPADPHPPRAAAGAELGHGSGPREGLLRREGVEVELVRVEQTPSALAGAARPAKARWPMSASTACCCSSRRAPTDLKAVTSPNKSLPYVIAGQGRHQDRRRSRRPHLRRRPRRQPRPLAVDEGALGRRPRHRRDGGARHRPAQRPRPGAGRRARSMPRRCRSASGCRSPTRPATTSSSTRSPTTRRFRSSTRSTSSPRRCSTSAAPKSQAVIRALIKISRDFASRSRRRGRRRWCPMRRTPTRPACRRLAATFAGSWSVNGGMNRDRAAVHAGLALHDRGLCRRCAGDARPMGRLRPGRRGACRRSAPTRAGSRRPMKQRALADGRTRASGSPSRRPRHRSRRASACPSGRRASRARSSRSTTSPCGAPTDLRHPPRAVRLRQDHAAADHRRPDRSRTRGTVRVLGAPPKPGPGDGLRVPVVPADPLAHGAGQCRVSARRAGPDKRRARRSGRATSSRSSACSASRTPIRASSRAG